MRRRKTRCNDWLALTYRLTLNAQLRLYASAPACSVRQELCLNFAAQENNMQWMTRLISSLNLHWRVAAACLWRRVSSPAFGVRVWNRYFSDTSLKKTKRNDWLDLYFPSVVGCVYLFPQQPTYSVRGWHFDMCGALCVCGVEGGGVRDGLASGWWWWVPEGGHWYPSRRHQSLTTAITTLLPKHPVTQASLWQPITFISICLPQKPPSSPLPAIFFPPFPSLKTLSQWPASSLIVQNCRFTASLGSRALVIHAPLLRNIST